MAGTARHKPARVLAAQPWPLRAGLALGLGALAVLALPNFYLVPVLLVAFSGLLWLLDAAKRGRTALFAGWWFGVGYFTAGLYWVVQPFYVDAAQHGWMAPFALVGLAAGMAVYPALAAGLAWSAARPGIGRAVALGLFWCGSEWLRGVLFTGFAWNLIGTVWAGVPAMMQGAAVVGLYGLGMLSVILAALPATIAVAGRAGWPALVLGVVGLGLAWAGGAWWLAQLDPARADPVHLRIVQPNIAQAGKWRRENRAAIFDDLVSLSLQPGRTEPDLVIWPETATPFFLAESADALQAVAAAAGRGHVITGTPRRFIGRDNQRHLLNSVLAVNGMGQVVDAHDKSHLVPFGEYLPLRALLEPLGLTKLVEGRIDYSPGPRGGRLVLPGLPVAAPLICYEVIFPSDVAAGATRPDWLLNLTNDAWFGDTTGPHQHLAAARFRAIEQGLPLVRAANTGISAVIDAKGRVLDRLALNRQGVIDAVLPATLSAPLYGRAGEAMLLPLIVIGLLIIGMADRRR